MDRRVASELRAGELATAVGDHLVDVHVELGSAARHPDMQREHVAMLAGQDLVASSNDQFVALIVKPFAVVVCDSCSLLQGRVCGYHFPRNQILPDAKMFKRTLGLSAPELVSGDIDDTEAVTLFPYIVHGFLLCFEQLR